MGQGTPPPPRLSESMLCRVVEITHGGARAPPTHPHATPLGPVRVPRRLRIIRAGPVRSSPAGSHYPAPPPPTPPTPPPRALPPAGPTATPEQPQPGRQRYEIPSPHLGGSPAAVRTSSTEGEKRPVIGDHNKSRLHHAVAIGGWLLHHPVTEHRRQATRDAEEAQCQQIAPWGRCPLPGHPTRPRYEFK